MSYGSSSDSYAWWASLKHGGFLVAPSKLAEFFPESLPSLPSWIEERLRRTVTRFNGDAETTATLLDTVLEEVLGLGRPLHPETGTWLKGNGVSADWAQRALTGEAVKPRRVWQTPNGAELAVFVDDAPRVGIGRGRRAPARVVEWLRKTDRRVALLTNGQQWRLIFAGLDAEAFCEWDIALWFEGGEPGLQVTALRALLSREALTASKEGERAPLLTAIEASRKAQAELSAVLGERVRRAVEILIQQVCRDDLPEGLSAGSTTDRALYLAATRVVMRMVVILFAEARDLLPRDNPIYHQSYGLQGLREALDHAGGGAGAERLRQYFGAWPRVLGLFRLVYHGSPHEALPVPRYGGGLFEWGDAESADAISRALTAFENPVRAPSDAVVHHVLELLCRGEVKVRQGKGSTWVEAPVDFSDLSSEYIGILYEGLLDYELHRAGAGDPIVFLALGDEPALPLSRLEAMDDSAVPALVEKFKVKKQLSAGGDEEDDGDEQEEDEEQQEQEEDDGEAVGPAAETDIVAEPDDAAQAIRERVRAWSRHAVTLGKLVPKAKSKKADARRAYEDAVERAAATLVSRIVLPGEWFLVRWGGTRKGAGTFYTRPALAVPTVQRTLRPLAYTPPSDAAGRPDDNAPAAQWTPKTPEEILRLKVCDSAMGSGSLLVAGLRFLTDALFESLFFHGWLGRDDDHLSVMADADSKPAWFMELVREMPVEVEEAEKYVRARLKRYVVERCIYGVDIDPLAAELARLSLWVETMDKNLPFEFLDHKLKVGNALVGCWFNYFRDYPALAWEREGGDKNHTNGVHFEKEAWSKTIKQFRNGLIKPELADWIRGQGSILDVIEGRSPEAVHDEALAALERMHALPVHETEERARFYSEQILSNPALARLRHAFDTWCAIWFWPADQLEHAPTPRTFENPNEQAREIVGQLRQQYRFFHWELEFPDVFAAPGGGFDAVAENPPWEIQKPNSKEFFSNIDPLYRAYGKQEALRKQSDYFEGNAEVERGWLNYCARFKALSNWSKHVGFPFGDASEGGEAFSLSRS